MTDGPEDSGEDVGKRVKDAMAGKKPVKGKANLRVIEGGAEKPKRPRRRKPKAEAPDDGPPPDEAPPHDGDGVDFGDDDEGYERPDKQSEAEKIITRFCAAMDQNDRDNGRRLIAWFGERLAYVTGLGWLVWRGTHWLRDEADLDVRLMAQEIVDKIKLEAFEIEATDAQRRLLDLADKAMKKDEDKLTAADRNVMAKAIGVRKAISGKRSKRRAWAVTSGNAGRTSAMLQQAQSLKALGIDKLDADHMKFNLLNGTLRFWRELDPDQPEGGERKIGKFSFDAHDRADFATKIADVDYSAEAKCPFVDEFLIKLHPDAAMRRFLQVSTAYALLLGRNDEQRLFYHYGTGANGKSAFIELIGRMAGSYRSVASPDTITGDTQRGGQQANPDIARLHNTRLVTIEELPKNVPLREELIKALTGGTKILARFLNKDFFEFMPIFTPMLSGNSKPAISGSDYGIWRRVLLILWGVTIPLDERMAPSLLQEKLDAERSGVLNWLIEGLMLYLAQGLEPFIPAEVRAFTQDYREERDNIGVFAEKVITPAPGKKIQAGHLFKLYQAWCEVNGLTAAKQRTFGDRLGELGYRKDRGRTYDYLDIEVDTSWKYDPTTSPSPPPAREDGDPGYDPERL